MTNLNYLVGDATCPVLPVGTDMCLILHITNCNGGWGAGFVLALSRRWPMRLLEGSPEYVYRNGAPESVTLGKIQLVQVEPYLQVINLCAQSGYKHAGNPVPLDYRALIECMKLVLDHVRNLQSQGLTVSVAGPKFGSDLAGGDWSLIEKIIDRVLVQNDIPVTIYTLA